MLTAAAPTLSERSVLRVFSLCELRLIAYLNKRKAAAESVKIYGML